MANVHITDTVVMGLEPGGWYFCEKDGYFRWRWFAMNGYVMLAAGSAFTRRQAIRKGVAAVTRLGRQSIDLAVGI